MSTITTLNARIKFAKAHGEGLPVPKITKIGWGNGGVDANGKLIELNENMTILPGEFIRKNVTDIYYPENNIVSFKSILNTEEGNGEYVSSCGLFDEENTLIAIKVFKPKYKDNETTIEIEWHEEF